MTQLRSVTCHVGSHSVPATRHKWTHPALTPATQAGTRFTYTQEGWKAELTWLDSAPAGSWTSDLWNESNAQPLHHEDNMSCVNYL